METNQKPDNPRVNIAYRRKKNAEEMKYQLVSFGMMLFLTIIAFIAVGYDGVDKWFKAPFIIILAVIQVIFQLFYFMHMNHKGHQTAALFLFSGVGFGLLTVLAFSTIVWW